MTEAFRPEQDAGVDFVVENGDEQLNMPQLTVGLYYAPSSYHTPETNEDFVAGDPENGLIVVADGMGGHGGGDVASKMATTTFGDTLQANLAGGVAPLTASRAAASAARSALAGHVRANILPAWDAGQRDKTIRARLQMGTTLTAMRILPAAPGEEVYPTLVFNAGDSRMDVLTPEGNFEQMTVEQGQGSGVFNVLTGASVEADDSLKLHDEHPVKSDREWSALDRYGKLFVDQHSVVDLRAGSRVLLATDGFWGDLPEQRPDPNEVARILRTIADPNAAAAALARLASKDDDRTIVVVDVAAPKQEEILPTLEEARMPKFGIGYVADVKEQYGYIDLAASSRNPEGDDYAVANSAQGIFAVADGVGGHGGGDVASYVVTEVFWRHIRDARAAGSTQPTDQLMHDATAIAARVLYNRQVAAKQTFIEEFELREEGLRRQRAGESGVFVSAEYRDRLRAILDRRKEIGDPRMGTTLTAVEVRPGVGGEYEATAFNAGDSRFDVYRGNTGELQQITTEHCMRDPRRPESKARNVLYNVVGGGNRQEVSASDGVQFSLDEPRDPLALRKYDEVIRTTVRKGDRLLLATDGFWGDGDPNDPQSDRVNPDDVAHILRTEPDAQRAAERLRALAKKNDDRIVMVVDVEN